MSSLPGFLVLLISILTLPLQIIHQVIFGLGDFLVFDLLNLGPYLPIPSPFA